MIQSLRPIQAEQDPGKLRTKQNAVLNFFLELVTFRSYMKFYDLFHYSTVMINFGISGGDYHLYGVQISTDLEWWLNLSLECMGIFLNSNTLNLLENLGSVPTCSLTLFPVSLYWYVSLSVRVFLFIVIWAITWTYHYYSVLLHQVKTH